LRNKSECFECHKPGHFRRDCRKYKARIAKEKSQGKLTEANQTYSKSLLLASQSAYTVINSQDSWIGDSGASNHMTYRRDVFDLFEEIDDGIFPITVGNNEVIYARGKGTVDVKSLSGGNVTLTDVLYVPKLGRNLLSLGAATKMQVNVKFNKDTIEMSKDDRRLATGYRLPNNLYEMDFVRVGSSANISAQEATLQIWHERLGHVNYNSVRQLANGSAVEGMKLIKCSTSGSDDNCLCEACIHAKQCRLPFNESNTRATKPGELIHYDLCGPMSVESYGGAKLMAVFVDDYSGFLFVKPLAAKSQIIEAIQEVIAEIKATGNEVRRTRSDNAREFQSTEMRKLMRKHSIVQEFSAPHCPQMNGRVERQNRTIVEMARAMLIGADLPRGLWAEAVTTAAKIRNCIPLKRLNNKTPQEILTGCKPNIGHLRIYGSKAFALIDESKRSKFDSKSEEMRLIGYEHKAYRLWQPGTRRVLIRRDAVIVEPQPQQMVRIVVPNDTDRSEATIEDIQTEDDHIEVNTKTRKKYKKCTIEVNADSIANQTRSKTQASMTMASIQSCSSAFIANIELPTTVEEAETSPEAEKWKTAMEDEISSLKQNHTWTLVEPPKDRKIIHNKWIFRIKTKPDGSIDRYKARLVKGCSQKQGIDFQETFSPVARFDSIRALLAMAATKDLEIIQIDVKTAFLYGTITEKIYMEQPDGFNDGTNRVCLLNKSLYGLRQAPHRWYSRFDSFMKEFGLKATNADPCIYTSNDGDLLVALYVDDGLIIGNCKMKINELLKAMQQQFEITSSDATCYLGIEIIRNRETKTIRLVQTAYTKAILERFGMTDCNPIATPMDTSTTLTPNMNKDPINVPYRQLIGSLMYLAIATRPDLAYSVAILSRFLDSPTKEHWNAGKRVLRYLSNTTDIGITYGHDKSDNLIAYSDADWANCVNTRRSTSGTILMLNGGPITWFSRKQGIVATSTTDAEYVAAHEAGKEIVWARRLLEEIGCEQKRPTTLYCDNAAAGKLITNPAFHRRTKHIDVKFHYTRKLIEDGIIDVKHVSSSGQLADILTKPKTRNSFEENRKQIGIYFANISASGSVEYGASSCCGASMFAHALHS